MVKHTKYSTKTFFPEKNPFFSEVFKARCKRTGKMVALKKILMENEKEGFPITALREVKMLQQLKHENITELIEVCCSKGNFYLYL